MSTTEEIMLRWSISHTLDLGSLLYASGVRPYACNMKHQEFFEQPIKKLEDYLNMLRKSGMTSYIGNSVKFLKIQPTWPKPVAAIKETL